MAKVKEKKLYHKLKSKFRLVIMRDDTFEEKLSFRLSRLNVFVATGTIVIILIIATTFIIAFTPLREYIPGYADVNIDRNLRELSLKVDSLQMDVMQKDLYIKNIKNIIEGKDGKSNVVKEEKTGINYDTIEIVKSKEDSLLRLEMENADQYSLAFGSNAGTAPSATSISSFLFFTPLKGIVISKFNSKTKHYGVDIVAAKNEAVKSTLDGTVIFSSWTIETGYSIAIQHSGNIVSVYKHNSTLLKKEGDYVEAGEVIAIVGSSGELSTGPHLHFEIWFNSNPVNPEEYIAF